MSTEQELFLTIVQSRAEERFMRAEASLREEIENFGHEAASLKKRWYAEAREYVGPIFQPVLDALKGIVDASGSVRSSPESWFEKIVPTFTVEDLAVNRGVDGRIIVFVAYEGDMPGSTKKRQFFWSNRLGGASVGNIIDAPDFLNVIDQKRLDLERSVKEKEAALKALSEQKDECVERLVRKWRGKLAEMRIAGESKDLLDDVLSSVDASIEKIMEVPSLGD